MVILVLFFIFLIVIIVATIKLTNNFCDRIDKEVEKVGEDLGKFLHHISKK